MKTKRKAAVSSMAGRLARLAEIVCTSIEAGHAKQIDEVFPGFYHQYQAAQKRWEEAPENQNFTVRRHR